MKKVLIIILIISFFTSCDSENQTNQKEKQSAKSLVPKCNSRDYYILSTGDKIIPKSKFPLIRIIHTSSNIRKICLLSGEVEID